MSGLISPTQSTNWRFICVPLYGCPASLAYWGTKTGSRGIFRRAGLPMPPGYEHLESMAEILEALRELKKEYPSLSKAVVKLNDGFSGEGNAIFSRGRRRPE